MHQCIKFILFWNGTLHVSDGLSIIRSWRLCIQQHAFVKQILLSEYLFDKCMLLYVQSLTPDDGRKDSPKHVECHSKIKYIWYIGASSWFYYRNNITMHGPVDIKLCIHLYIQRVKYSKYFFYVVSCSLWGKMQQETGGDAIRRSFMSVTHLKTLFEWSYQQGYGRGT